jgi:signal transduction histidine kinase/ABC-type multidrug transport system ATPase subunit
MRMLPPRRAAALTDAGPSGPIVSLSGVGKRFGGEPVLDSVDLNLYRGEIVALVGENGAGKTTLVRCIAGALPPDTGSIRIAPGADGRRAEGGVAVVWQDLALCDNLDVIANLFLGREGRFLAEETMEATGRRLLAELGIDLGDVRRPVDTLSGGERQLLAIARAMLARPSLLVLDEPTSALAVAAARRVAALVGELRATGTAVLLVSHRPEEVFELADRIVVLRRGEVVATLSAPEAHPDDVTALMSGVEVESTARRKLERLRHLAVQLSGVEATGSLPLIVSSAASALGVDQLCLHLLDPDVGTGPARLRRSADVGLPAVLLAATEELPSGPDGGLVGRAAQAGELVVMEDFRRQAGRLDPATNAALAAGLQSAWAAPIVGNDGLLGVLSGYSRSAGRPTPDQLELVAAYAAHAAAAIERGRLLGEVTRRNRILENLRMVLETLAGPDRIQGGLDVALLALCRGLGADGVTLEVEQDGAWVPRADVQLTPGGPEDGRFGDSLSARLALPEGDAVLVARWASPPGPTAEARELLEDGARSLRLALEREALEAMQQEATTLRRSHHIQREFLSRLSHELRTPLTAIHGYASSLSQPDVTWDKPSEDRFLSAIVSESARMSRLVADLLDSSALESGVLRLNCDWCELGLLLHSAVSCLPAGAPVDLWCDPGLKPIWGDHDRLEQVFVNLIDNALRHTPPGTPVRVTATPGQSPGTVEVRISDEGPGIPPAEAEQLFLPYRRGGSGAPGAGLGLSIARGIAEAHGGSLTLEPAPAGACFVVALPADPPGAAGAGHDEIGTWDAGGVSANG